MVHILKCSIWYEIWIQKDYFFAIFIEFTKHVDLTACNLEFVCKQTEIFSMSSRVHPSIMQCKELPVTYKYNGILITD